MKELMVKREIQMLREVVEKLVPLLAGQGLRVTQRGMSAYVQFDPKTLKPTVVNIPSLPDDASDDLILAIQGFIDHEVGHVLFSDWTIPLSIGDNKKLHALCNIVEDPYVERKFGEKFPGAVHNISRLHEFFVNRLTLPALDKAKGNLEDEFRILLVPLVRAWSGQKFFQTFIEGYLDHPVLKGFIDAMPKDAIARFPHVANSTESLELALIMEEVLTPKAKAEPEPETTEDGDDKTESSGGMGAPSRAGIGEAPPDAEIMKDDKGEGDDDEEARSDGDDTPAPDAGDDVSEDDATSEETSADDSEPGETEDDSEDDGAAASEDDEDEGETGEDGEDEDAGADDSSEELIDAGGAEDDMESSEAIQSPFDAPIDITDADTFEGRISERIGDDMADAMRDSDYTIYSRDFDKIEVFEPSDWQDKWLTRLDDQVAHMVGPMQKDIERMMAARSLVQRIPGFRSGKLHGAGLHRLAVGDDRIFRRRHEIKAVETAVCLLVDNSGSMAGGRKIEVAMAAAYALSQTLDRVRVSHEVIGFTTYNNHDLYGEMTRIREDEKRMGCKYTRTEPLWMPIFKQFHERMTPTVRKRFAAAPHDLDLSQNVDGECIEIATMRLLKRTERRKVLIVLSDGSPACLSPYPAKIERQTKLAVEKAERLGVETIGIGILDRSVTHFYPKNIVLNRLEDLPKTVMGELRKVLQAA